MISVSMRASEIAGLFDSALGTRLAPLGFWKSPAGHYTKTLSPGVSGHFGYALYRDRRTAEARAWPVAGVRLEVVERLLCELSEKEFDPHGSFTVGKPLGFFMPRWDMAEWPVRSVSEAASVAQSVVTALEQYGLPYMERHSGLREAVHELSPDQRGGSHDGPKLAVLYFLLGESESALNVLDYQSERVAKGSYPDEAEFYRFTSNLRERIARGHGPSSDV